jgi:hypothetical protein
LPLYVFLIVLSMEITQFDWRRYCSNVWHWRRVEDAAEAYRNLVRVSVPLRATHGPGPCIVVLYAETGNGRAISMSGLGPSQTMKHTEVVRVTDGALLQIQISACDSERGVHRSVAMHVRIAQLELANSDRSIVVSTRIIELTGRLAWYIK